MAALIDLDKLRKTLKEFFNVKTTHKTDSSSLFLMKNDGYYGVEFLGFGRNDGGSSWVRDLEEARDFSNYSTEQLASVYAQTSRHNPDTHYVFVSFRLKAEFKRYDMDSEEMLEALRASALAKLSEAEIRALGAEKLAVYNKLKFHNADTDNED
jgi:hypothetical protein